MSKMNLNQRVRITLRPRGYDAWRQYHRSLGLEPPPLESGTLDTELWMVARIFGSEMVMGLDPPIQMDVELLPA